MARANILQVKWVEVPQTPVPVQPGHVEACEHRDVLWRTDLQRWQCSFCGHVWDKPAGKPLDSNETTL